MNGRNIFHAVTKNAFDHFDQDSLIGQIKKDFLNFSLSYSCEGQSCEFTLHNGTTVAILADGVIAFNAQHYTKQSKSILLSCGIHGNETAPIEICNHLVYDLLNEKIQARHRVVFIFGNLASMQCGERFIEENLNRLFSKAHSSTSLEGHRAAVLMDIVDTFFNAASTTSDRIHYDLHTAIRPSKNEKFAVYPFLHGREYCKKQLAFMAECDVKTILLSQSPTTTFSYYSSVNHNAHAFTVELGRVMPFGQNDMSKFAALVHNLTQLLCDDELSLPSFYDCTMDIYTVNQVINKHHNDFTLHFDDNIANFEIFAKGTLIASETNAEYRAMHDGEAIVFPNANVAIGQRALLTVIPHEL